MEVWKRWFRKEDTGFNEFRGGMSLLDFNEGSIKDYINKNKI